jgi:hypothetical protein
VLLNRVEFLGDKFGRPYQVNTDDERIIIEKETLYWKSAIEKERIIDNELDTFEDGYNTLEEIDGALYEVHESYFVRIMRKAYIEEVGQ